MQINRETIATAYAYHQAFFSIMAIATLEPDEAEDMAILADETWRDTFLPDQDMHSVFDAPAAVRQAMKIMEHAVQRSSRDGTVDPGEAARLVLEEANGAGVGSMMLIQKVVH